MSHFNRQTGHLSQLGQIRKSISAISRTQLALLQDGDVGIGVFLSEGVLTGSRQPSIGCNHGLFLAQKIQVSVTADGMRIDDGGEVT